MNNWKITEIIKKQDEYYFKVNKNEVTIQSPHVIFNFDEIDNEWEIAYMNYEADGLKFKRFKNKENAEKRAIKILTKWRKEWIDEIAEVVLETKRKNKSREDYIQSEKAKAQANRLWDLELNTEFGN